jgi:hypothetical protein
MNILLAVWLAVPFHLPLVSDHDICIALSGAVCERAHTCGIIDEHSSGKCFSVFSSVCKTEGSKKKHPKRILDEAVKSILKQDCDKLVDDYFR